MITEKTTACTFFKNGCKCILLNASPVHCDRCQAFHVYEINLLAREMRKTGITLINK